MSTTENASTNERMPQSRLLGVRLRAYKSVDIGTTTTGKQEMHSFTIQIGYVAFRVAYSKPIDYDNQDYYANAGRIYFATPVAWNKRVFFRVYRYMIGIHWASK